MQRDFCPYCNHCKMIAEMAAKADVREKLEELAKQEEEERRQEGIRKGKIYDRDFQRYRVKDIQNISDIDFLWDMAVGVVPAGQPQTEWELDELNRLGETIRARIEELEK